MSFGEATFGSGLGGNVMSLQAEFSTGLHWPSHRVTSRPHGIDSHMKSGLDRNGEYSNKSILCSMTHTTTRVLQEPLPPTTREGWT